MEKTTKEKTTKKTTAKKIAKKKPAKKATATKKVVAKKKPAPVAQRKRAEKKPVKKPVKKPKKKLAKYYKAVGRRKTAVARVRLFTRGEKEFFINEKPYNIYFPILKLQQIVTASLKKMKALDKFRVLIKVKGGGIRAQAEAIRHGTARALVLFNPDFKKRLRKAGFLTRDPRMRERKKFGLKRARRAPQWQKR